MGDAPADVVRVGGFGEFAGVAGLARWPRPARRLARHRRSQRILFRRPRRRGRHNPRRVVASPWGRAFPRAASVQPPFRGAGAIASMTVFRLGTDRGALFQEIVVPSARGSSGEPGTAKTSLPCSFARRAVMSEPDRRAASTTKVAWARPATMRLRLGNRAARFQPSGISLSAAPLSQMRSNSRHFRLDRQIMPARQDSDRAASQRRLMGTRNRCHARGPKRRPRPASARPRPGARQGEPAAEALREPTIATMGRCSTASSPRTAMSGGAVSMVASRLG